jgi:hypothetical protein
MKGNARGFIKILHKIVSKKIFFTYQPFFSDVKVVMSKVVKSDVEPSINAVVQFKVSVANFKVNFSANALVSVDVPYSSVPQMYSVLCAEMINIFF